MNKFIKILLTLFILYTPISAQETGYPISENKYINDFAGVINSADKKVLKKILLNLEKRTGIELTIVTVDSIYNYETGDKSIESFAKRLFNTWGVGKKETNNGIMLLLAVTDRKIRVQLGQGYPDRYNSLMKNVIDDKMIPYFKEGDYSRGIYEGVQGIISTVTKKVSWLSFYKYHIILAILIVVMLFAGINMLKQGKKGWGWVLIGGAGILLIFLLKMLFMANQATGGFGGGSSGGGGATGSW